MKQGIDYFSHWSDASDSPTFSYLRSRYGWEGEGRYWALVGLIAKSKEVCLDYGKKFIKAHIANKLGMKMNELHKFVDFLHKDCELLIRRGDYLTTQNLQDTYLRIKRERDKARQRRGTSIPTNSPEPLKSSDEHSNKVKKKKVKKSKEKGCKGTHPPNTNLDLSGRKRRKKARKPLKVRSTKILVKTANLHVINTLPLIVNV